MKQELPVFIKKNIREKLQKIVEEYKEQVMQAKETELKEIVQKMRGDVWLVLATEHIKYGGIVDPYVAVLIKTLEEKGVIEDTKCVKK